jgi:hypothetical protein
VILLLPRTASTSSVAKKAKMPQSAPSKLLVSRMLHETVQIAHHNRESLRLHEFDYNIWNFVGFD